MDRQRTSWLIVRAFGLYLLIQAFLLVPEILAGLFAARYYSNILSSTGSESGSLSRVSTSMYRTLAIAPLLRVVLYSAVGIYMLRGGRFLVHLLERRPAGGTDVADPNDEQLDGREPR